MYYYTLVQLLIHLSQDVNVKELVCNNYSSINSYFWFQTRVKFLRVEQVRISEHSPKSSQSQKAKTCSLLSIAALILNV